MLKAKLNRLVERRTECDLDSGGVSGSAIRLPYYTLMPNPPSSEAEALRPTILQRLIEGMGYFWLFTFGLLVFGTIIDHIVNSTLYDFGLVFSWEWFNAYGLAWTLLWIFIGLRGACLYWFSEDEPSKLFAFNIFITTLAEWIGGFSDIFWFLMEGVLPAPTMVWWWMPFASWLGLEWTIIHHAVYTLAWVVGLSMLWIQFRKRR